MSREIFYFLIFRIIGSLCQPHYQSSYNCHIDSGIFFSCCLIIFSHDDVQFPMGRFNAPMINRKRKITGRHGKRPAFLPQYMCPQENRSFIFWSLVSSPIPEGFLTMADRTCSQNPSFRHTEACGTGTEDSLRGWVRCGAPSPWWCTCRRWLPHPSRCWRTARPSFRSRGAWCPPSPPLILNSA